MTTFTGNDSTVTRMLTGLTTLDLAVAGRPVIGGVRTLKPGLPLGCYHEIYGKPDTGKNTLADYLVGMAPGREVVIACVAEILDRDYARSAIEQSGRTDKVIHIVELKDEKGVRRAHEDVMKAMVRKLREPGVGAAIFDNVNSVQPRAEADGDYGEAFVGKRAKLMAQFGRDLVGVFLNIDEPKVVFFLNHVTPVIGSMVPGMVTTPGGDVYRSLAKVRLMTWRKSRETKHLDGAGFVAEGKVEKNTYGGKGREFQFVVLDNIGLSRDLTAVEDCLALGLAEKNSQGYLMIDGEKLPRHTQLVLHAQLDNKPGLFQPFHAALARYVKAECEAALKEVPTENEAETNATDLEPVLIPRPAKKKKGRQK